MFFNIFLALDMLVLYAFVLCPPEDGELKPKHVGECMSVYDIWLYINYVHLLVYIEDYSRNARTNNITIVANGAKIDVLYTIAPVTV